MCLGCVRHHRTPRDSGGHYDVSRGGESVFPELMVPAAVSPEMAAHVAEPFEVAVLAPAPCVVVVPSIALPALHVTVEATVDEHCSCPVKETVNELLLFFYGYHCRASRGVRGICCRTSRGVRGIFSSTRCLSYLGYEGCLQTPALL